MWRSVINTLVVIVFFVSHLHTAPAYPHFCLCGRETSLALRALFHRDTMVGPPGRRHQHNVTWCPLGCATKWTPPVRGPRYTVRSGQEASKPFVEVKNATYHGSGPREEARAMCSVKTLEVNATANATITRRLHGVVTSRELQSSIQRLEVIIFGQMHQLWQSLDALRAQLGGQEAPFPNRHATSFRFQPEG